MYIHGSFADANGEVVTVHIVTSSTRTPSLEIGTDVSGIYFSDDPVDITSEVNDTFDVLLRHSACLRLQCRDYMSDFFCTSCRDAVVNIYRGGVCLFAGFIEPQTLSQPYNEVYDEVELNCIDVLSALQYSRYKDVGSAGAAYDIVKGAACQRTLHSILTDILDGITSGMDIAGGHSVRYLYDGSKAVDSVLANRYAILEQVSISELLFLGSDEDEVWRQDEVLEEILRYLNLHIVQDGLTFYIFSWETCKSGGSISWCDIVRGGSETMWPDTVAIETSIAADCDTVISLCEVFNQILLTCSVEKADNVIESPLDGDLLTSPYTWFQKYCTEYSADGEGNHAYNAFFAMTHERKTDYGAGRIVDWFLQVMSNSQWIFPKNGDLSRDLISTYCNDNEHQEALPNWLGSHPGAAIIALGSVETNCANDDNRPTSKVNMTNCLVVSVNGNGKDGENAYYPDASDIRANIPYAVYNGNIAGGTFSPADDSTTNYIVLSGKVVLNPLMEMTGTYKALHDAQEWSRSSYWHKTVPSRDNPDGRYYTRQYWKAGTPSEDAVWDTQTDFGLVPFTGKGPEWYEFKYSAVGDSSDTISKIAVLACMLIIGDKCVCEKTPSNDWGTGVPYTGHGLPDDFVWKEYKPLSECSSEDEYYQQSFTIGFDPKIGDKLIGTEYDLQTNFSYTLGIDAEGIAIPIRKSDRVSGQVRFMILGPVNTVWDEYTRRHPTFFRHTRWGLNSVPLLSHVSNIVVKQFEVKVYSDNGHLNNTEDNDIVYMSDTREEFKNEKSDLEFRINSALTSAECQSLGVTNSVNLSTPVNELTGDALLSIYDYCRGLQAKPEQLYVDSYYSEYHLPRVLMEQKLTDANGIIGLFNHYTHPALQKTFFVQGISRNLLECRADLTIKETGL
ncbi:MAG: hypothetical protein IKZ61_11880 [Prevotella sp.]|nr:hypothetical protein [Prevotella sp.]